MSLITAVFGIAQILATEGYIDLGYVDAEIIFSFLYLIAFIIIYPSLIYAISSNEVLSFTETLSRGSKYTVSFVFLVLLSTLVIFGGLSLLFIPGIALTIYLAFSSINIITENRKGTDALLRSWFYVEGYWWAVFWRFIFVLFLAMLVTFAIGFGLGFSVIYTETTPIGNIVVGSFLSLINDLVFAPISLIYSYGLYLSLKQVKEASGAVETPNKRRAIIKILAVLGVVVILGLLTLAVLFPG